MYIYMYKYKYVYLHVIQYFYLELSHSSSFLLLQEEEVQVSHNTGLAASFSLFWPIPCWMRKLSKGHRSADEKHREHELRSMLISPQKLPLCNYSSNILQKKRALSPLQPPWQIWCSLQQGNQAWSRAGQLGLENSPFWCLRCWRGMGALALLNPLLAPSLKSPK